MQQSRLLRELPVLAGFCAFLFFFGLGSFGLVGADEPRYAQIAREMLARQDWITPVLYGQPWLEKPVLYYWQAMLAYSVFGVSDWAARLPSALSASAMVLAVYLFVRRIRPGAQLDAALMTASTAAVIGFGRAASTDMPLSATFTIAMLCWFTWHQTGRTVLLAGFYVFLALATLAKGPVAVVLAGAIILAFGALRRDLGITLARTLWLPGMALFCLVSLPWYIGVEAENAEFFQVFFVQHNLARFGTNMFRHKQPFWYYVPVLLIATLPWLGLVLAGLASALRKLVSEGARSSPLPAFLLCWIAVPLVFFSIAQSKLPGYVLPLAPPLMLLAAEYLWERERLGRGLLVAHSALAAMVLAAVLLMHYGLLRVPPTRQALAVAGAAAGIVFVAMLLTLWTRGTRLLRFVTLVPVVVGVAFILKVGGPALDAHLSARQAARELGRIEIHKAEIAAFNVRRETEYGLAFYRDEAVERYERAEVPRLDHLLVARRGSQADFSVLLGGRRASRVGGYEPQGLEFFWISTPQAHHH